MVSGIDVATDPLLGRKIWELWERETGLDYAISLAETSAYTLPRPLSPGQECRQECLPPSFWW